MTVTKYFLTADIEEPHRSYYAETDEQTQALGFLYRWAWAEPDGSPPEGAVYFTDRADADEALRGLREHGAGIRGHADTIEIKELLE